MKRKDQYIDSDNAYHEPSRDPYQGFTPLVVVVTILMVVLTAVLAIVYFRSKETNEHGSDVTQNSVSTDYIHVASPTPTPVPPLQENQNPILYPATANANAMILTDDASADMLPQNHGVVIEQGEISKDALPSTRGTTQMITSNDNIVSEYARTQKIAMGDPLFYSTVPGILTFRGNNFRNCASFGYVTKDPNDLKQVWEFSGIGSRLASTMNFEWTGVAFIDSLFSLADISAKIAPLSSANFLASS